MPQGKTTMFLEVKLWSISQLSRTKYFQDFPDALKGEVVAVSTHEQNHLIK